ncbi:hypothetical protein BU23DRAFT_566370 [Bimuria novae-zelandiae CBS 107.79]|uniref:Uncharacterized protein n=1 Tax=Bimuria novae-zelandiae CBS 107.79 TaxID=1447943 RepID=A0A6A5VEX8_9PLEO|nr:hypothetical protein BU23DRAFT_566370 [Bimuria novae-zelandiae CBS 107.79]
MVLRLFVLPGEGQLPTNPRAPEPLPADPPWYNAFGTGTMIEGALTGALSLVGRNKLGTFLKLNAYCTSATLAYASVEFYAHNELQSALLKRASIEKQPFKLWEKSNGWTLDDIMLAGTTTGLLASLHRKNFLSAVGWKRYFGVLSTSVAVGTLFGPYVLRRWTHYGEVDASFRQQVVALQTMQQPLLDDHLLEPYSGPVRWLIKFLHYTLELDYIWYQLALKEDKFFRMAPDDIEADFTREEVKALWSMAEILWARKGLFDFFLADARKTYEQRQHMSAGHQDAWTPQPLEDYALPRDWG